MATLNLTAGRLAALALSFGLVHAASAQSADQGLPATAKTFTCGDRGAMRAAIGEKTGFLAYVQFSGQPVRVLSPRAPTGEPRIEWSDGVRTLTWEPGVHISWRENGASPIVACGFSHHDPSNGKAAAGHEGHTPGKDI